MHRRHTSSRALLPHWLYSPSGSSASLASSCAPLSPRSLPATFDTLPSEGDEDQPREIYTIRVPVYPPPLGTSANHFPEYWQSRLYRHHHTSTPSARYHPYASKGGRKQQKGGRSTVEAARHALRMKRWAKIARMTRLERSDYERDRKYIQLFPAMRYNDSFSDARLAELDLDLEMTPEDMEMEEVEVDSHPANLAQWQSEGYEITRYYDLVSSSVPGSPRAVGSIEDSQGDELEEELDEEEYLEESDEDDSGDDYVEDDEDDVHDEPPSQRSSAKSVVLPPQHSQDLLNAPRSSPSPSSTSSWSSTDSGSSSSAPPAKRGETRRITKRGASTLLNTRQKKDAVIVSPFPLPAGLAGLIQPNNCPAHVAKNLPAILAAVPSPRDPTCIVKYIQFVMSKHDFILKGYHCLYCILTTGEVKSQELPCRHNKNHRRELLSVLLGAMKDPTLFERQGRTFEKIVLFFHYAKALLTVPPQNNPPEDRACPELWERYDLLVEQYPALIQQYDEFSREFASLTLTHWSAPSAYQGRVWEFKKKYLLLEERAMAAVDVFFPSCSCGQTYSRFDSLRRHVKTATNEYSRPKDERSVPHGWNRYRDDPLYAMKYLQFKMPGEEDLPV